MKNTIDEIIAYNEYMNYLANNSKDPYGIDKIIEKLGTDYRRFFDNLISYIDKNITKPKYVFIFERIIETIAYNHSLDINKYLYNQGITPQELQINFNKFLTYFRPDIKYTNENLSKLYTILYKYSEYYDKIKQREQIFITNSSISKQLILEFIDSPYSLERFILSKGITSTEFKNLLGFAKKHDIENYQKFKYIMDRKNEIKNATIQNDILKILSLIQELGINFTSIDLFKETLYGPRELVKAADAYLTGEDLKLFRLQVNKYKDFTFTTTILPSLAIKGFIKNTFNFTIDGKLVTTTEEERQMIIEDLSNHYIPITSRTFMEAYKKYYREKDKIKYIKA